MGNPLHLHLGSGNRGGLDILFYSKQHRDEFCERIKTKYGVGVDVLPRINRQKDHTKDFCIMSALYDTLQGGKYDGYISHIDMVITQNDDNEIVLKWKSKESEAQSNEISLDYRFSENEHILYVQWVQTVSRGKDLTRKMMALAIHILLTREKPVDILMLEANAQPNELPPQPYYVRKLGMKCIPGMESGWWNYFGLPGENMETCAFMTKLYGMFRKGENPSKMEIESLVDSAEPPNYIKELLLRAGINKYIKLWNKGTVIPDNVKELQKCFTSINMRLVINHFDESQQWLTDYVKELTTY